MTKASQVKAWPMEPAVLRPVARRRSRCVEMVPPPAPAPAVAIAGRRPNASTDVWITNRMNAIARETVAEVERVIRELCQCHQESLHSLLRRLRRRLAGGRP